MGAETADSNKPPRIRLGMVGGGRDAFIGGVHRMAARLDDHYELIAGAFSSTEEKSKASAAELGIDDSRAYATYKDCLLYTSPSPRDRQKSRMPSSA